MGKTDSVGLENGDVRITLQKINSEISKSNCIAAGRLL